MFEIDIILFVFAEKMQKTGLYNQNMILKCAL